MVSKVYSWMLVTVALACNIAVTAVAKEELNYAKDEATLLQAARAIIAKDPDCALITLDDNGQPRSRTVTASQPDKDMTIWIATKHSTRKVKQIMMNPRVTLYFNDDPSYSYVSIMGRATLHDDLSTKIEKNFYGDAKLKALWPEFPDDYLLIKVEPEWIEVTGHGVASRGDDWRPQASVFEKKDKTSKLAE
jgi:general stress protein 26